MGFLNLPITKRGTFSQIILAQTITVILSLLRFPPFHVSPLKLIVLSGRHFQNKPVPSALKMSSGLYSASKKGRVYESKSEVISGVTEEDSPHIRRKAMLFLALKCSSQPVLQ